MLYVQQIPLRYSRAVRLGFNTLQNSVLQLCCRTPECTSAFTYICSRRERVGECAVGSKQSLRTMGIRAACTVAPPYWNPTGSLRRQRQLARKISSTVHTYSYVSHFEDRPKQPTMCSKGHLVRPVSLRYQQLPYLLWKAALHYHLYNSSPQVDRV